MVDIQKKINRILRNHEQKRKALQSAKTGTFLYYNGFKAEIVKFPLFTQEGKPYEWKKALPPVEPQKKITKSPKEHKTLKAIADFVKAIPDLLLGFFTGQWEQ